MTTNDLELAISSGELQREGSFGKVYLCRVDEEYVAVKHIAKSDDGEKELSKLNRCQSDFVVRVLLSQVGLHGAFIAMEYCPADLYDVSRSCALSEEDIAFYFAEISLGLDFIHKQNIIHGDIKPENICITPAGHVRIIDFGNSTQLQDPEQRVVTGSGTLPYADPQILKRLPHGKESDWWSFGVLLFELLFLCLPFDIDEVNHESVPDVETEICNRICVSPLDYPLSCTKNVDGSAYFQFVAKFLQRDPNLRIRCFDELLNSAEIPFQINWSAATKGSLQPPIALCPM